MNRRSFMATLGGFAGFTAAAHETIEETSTPVETYAGPFCVEVYSPHAHRDRSLPIFNNIREARNLALARMNMLKKDMKDPARAGKILITKPNGSVVECMTWGTGWSQTVCYLNCDHHELS